MSFNVTVLAQVLVVAIPVLFVLGLGVLALVVRRLRKPGCVGFRGDVQAAPDVPRGSNLRRRDWGAK